MKIGDKVSAIDEDLQGTITSVKGEIVVFKDKYGFTHQFKKINWCHKIPKFTTW
ncbi:hypothetical protein LDL59_14070 [Kaistella anthropi]|nr:hypothetical protein [Kaistella anthropi]